ncbi:methylmalonyl-CoA epimerase [Immundisolibacter sp.]|uniref:methylmalonyl-CoA epimerase n=1 Tax=Immundisolibacter sp. TaxID=1934948 RepID=UPI003F82882E
MIGRLNHVAIATRDLAAAAERYRAGLAGPAQVSDPVPLPEHGVTTVFVDTGNTKLELLEPLGDQSPIARFLEKNPDGGLHHLCFEVPDLTAAIATVKAAGIRVLGEPRIGAHGLPVVFLHPKDCGGVLMELEQTAA